MSRTMRQLPREDYTASAARCGCVEMPTRCVGALATQVVASGLFANPASQRGKSCVTHHFIGILLFVMVLKPWSSSLVAGTIALPQ
jgi:hypothetical protein